MFPQQLTDNLRPGKHSWNIDMSVYSPSFKFTEEKRKKTPEKRFPAEIVWAVQCKSRITILRNTRALPSLDSDGHWPVTIGQKNTKQIHQIDGKIQIDFSDHEMRCAHCLGRVFRKKLQPQAGCVAWLQTGRPRCYTCYHCYHWRNKELLILLKMVCSLSLQAEDHKYMWIEAGG